MIGILVKKVVIGTARRISKMDAGDLVNQDTINSAVKATYHIVKHILF